MNDLRKPSDRHRSGIETSLAPRAIIRTAAIARRSDDRLVGAEMKFTPAALDAFAAMPSQPSSCLPQTVRTKKYDAHGATFLLRHIQPNALFEMRSIWRGQIKVQISDIHRTMIDLLADPSTGGGIRHVADCFSAYLKHKDTSPQTLVQYAEKLGNGAVFKRMGFLAKTHPDQNDLAEACRKRLTQGNAKLDPSLDCPRLVRAWRLWIPETWAKARLAAKERAS